VAVRKITFAMPLRATDAGMYSFSDQATRDAYITRQIDCEMLHQLLPDWWLVDVAPGLDVFDPAIETAIQRWVGRTCRSEYNYALGCGLFSDQADAALFRLFWS
jgi:hypothetical protein